jgi:nucleotide-binding universal stress UspA family protein
MQNILVPVDFSEASFSAATYALHLAAELHSPKVILYHAYQAPLTIDSPVTAVQVFDEAQLRRDSIAALERFRSRLEKDCPPGCFLEIYCEYSLLINGVDEVCQFTNCNLVVMGVTGGGAMTEKLIGSNTVSVARHSSVPVIIVPKEAVYRPIRKIVLLTDYEHTDENIPVSKIHWLLDHLRSALQVLHIEKNPEVKRELQEIVLLKDHQPTYHVVHHSNFVEGISDFIDRNEADWIITLPKDHGFFSSLFTTSHTTRLAFHSKIPVLAIHG